MPSNRDPLLEISARALVKNLGGTWREGGAMCRCPAHDDRSPSLSVRIGDRSLLFKCFAGCTATEILRAIRGLRLDVPSVAPVKRTSPTGDPAIMAVRARQIWDTAAALPATPGEHYLRSRGLSSDTSALRYHPHTPLGRGRHVRFRGAIIAPIVEGTRLVAIQRLFLDPATAALAVDLPNPKLALGRPLAGSVRLAPCGAILGLAEGVETAMSAMILLGIPVWATLGNERLPRIRLPDTVEHLVLLPDADRPGRTSARRAAQAHARRGRIIETQLPWFGLNDWNDVLVRPAGFGDSCSVERPRKGGGKGRMRIAA